VIDRPGEVRSLTGLRGVAASYVVLYHFTLDARLPGFVGTIVRHGYVAVDAFFVLSGFVMAMTYGAPFTRAWTCSDFGRFIVMRLGRIYPLFFVATLAATALAAARPTVSTVLANLTLVQGWGIAYSVDQPAWSISTEFGAYLLFPVLAWLVLRPGYRGMIVAAIASAELIFTLSQARGITLDEIGRHGALDFYGPGSAYALIRCLAGFTLGIVAWRLSTMPSVAHVARTAVAGWCCAAVAIALLAVRSADPVIVLSFVPLLLTLSASGLGPARLLASPSVYWLGVVSYSIYLVHAPLYDYAFPRAYHALTAAHVAHAMPLVTAALAAATIGLAAVTYYAIEKPGRDFTRRLVRRARPAAPIAATAAAPIAVPAGAAAEA